MPYFNLETNVSKDKITTDFLKATSKLIADTLGKPESYVVVHVNADQMMMWAGSCDPAGNATLLSIGKLGIEENKKHSKVISAHLTKNLGIPKDRLYIHFINAPPSTIGYDGSTFHPSLGNN